MSEKIPNQEDHGRQFDDVPLPDPDKSWRKMKEKLDEDDRRRRVIPLFLRSCMVWGLVLLLLGGGAYLAWDHLIVEDKPVAEGRNTPVKPASTAVEQGKEPAQPEGETHATIPENTPELKSSSPAAETLQSVKTSSKANKGTVIITKTNQAYTAAPKRKKQASQIVSTGETAIVDQPADQSAEAERLKTHDLPPDRSDPVVRVEEEKPAVENLQDTASKRPMKKPAKRTADTLVVKHEPLKDFSSDEYYLSGGLGLQQQIPIKGQQSVTYDYYGRKSSISDYIPSLFLRFEKEEKWFIMGEFRYGAPSVLKDFSYNRKTTLDTGNMVLNTTSLSIKKTYYHQFPFSFNYYIQPGWSVGLGGMYSRFYGAVVEKETKTTNIQTNSEVVSKQMMNIRGFNDSFFYKTQVHLMLQTDYQWNNFIFGLRYSQDIQPFIKYTRPNGEINTARNFSLQAIIRYQLFRARI